MSARFVFKTKKSMGHYILSLHLPMPLYTRLKSAATVHGIKDGAAGRTKERLSMQEFVRQMIDHCLKDMGV